MTDLEDTIKKALHHKTEEQKRETVKQLIISEKLNLLKELSTIDPEWIHEEIRWHIKELQS